MPPDVRSGHAGRRRGHFLLGRDPQAHAVVIVLVGILPLLNAVNCWDSALSFNVYSGNVSRAEIWLAPQGVAALPPSLARLLESRDPAIVLDFDAWSRNEFQANQYPENRIFQAVFQGICTMVPPGAATMYVIEKASWLAPRRVHRYDAPGVSAEAPAE
jgi:hypothetical protein